MNPLLKYGILIFAALIGVLTTIVSLLTYYLLVSTVFDPNNAIELQITNIISWIVCVTFAYFTNRIYVFKVDNEVNAKEVISFYASRLSTLFIDMLLMFVFVTLLSFNDKVVKLAVQVIIIILNYILSKFIVFKKN